MKKYLIFLLALPLFAGLDNLKIDDAIEILKNKNLELKISRFNEQMKEYEINAAKGHNYGKLDVAVTGMRSNDAGNVFGFKLQSREATFGDFGFSDFLGDLGTMMGGQQLNHDPLLVAPNDLNFPKDRNHFQTKISYMLPIYTGGKLTQYGKITESLYTMSKLDTKKLLNMKIYETRKAYYDISLVGNYISNLSKIIKNIKHLEDIIKNMGDEGYAREIDLLEVQARKAEAQSMYNQAKLNKDLAYQFLSFLLNTEVDSIVRLSGMAKMIHRDDINIEDNLDLQKAQLGLKITKMAKDLEMANFLPTVGAFGEYGSADNKLWNDFKDKDSYTVGVQFSWNIFNGGIDKANYEKAKLNQLKVQDQVSMAKLGIALKVRKLQTEILSKNYDITSYKKQLKFANKVYESYQTRYKEGISSISDVLIKQSKELEILLKLLTVKNDRNTKVFELNSILNKGV